MAQKGKLTTADYLEIDEFNRLLKMLHLQEKYIWELYCTISFCTALRISDVLTLKWKNIIDTPTLTIQEKKTKKNRKININNNIQKKIKSIYELVGSPDAEQLIFQNRKTNKAYSREQINRLLKQFKFDYKLKIGAFSTHTFRKTFGRYVYESNNKSAESLILLNTIFCHSSIEITKVYIGLRQSEIDEVFNSIKI